jgi:hypothetical protein
MRRLLLTVTAALVPLIAALALLTGSNRSSSVATSGYRAGALVAYGEGASSNPDVGRLGDGIGLATIIGATATSAWGSPRWIVPLDGAWLTGRHFIADDARGDTWVLAMRDNRFAPGRRLRPLWPRSYGRQAVSRDGRHVAATRARRQGGGYAPSSTIAVTDLDGRNRRTFSAGLVIGWSNRDEVAAAQANGDVLLVDARTGRRRVLLSAKRANRRLRARAVEPERAAWSADGRFAAIRVQATYVRRPHHRRGSTILLLDTTRPRVVRVLASRYNISLFAWAPHGERFAYTTSGFPAPHELWVAERPGRTPRRLFATGERHFDWFTWAPGSTQILLDDQLAQTWRLFSLDGAPPRALTRLGGRPLWCCAPTSILSIQAG